MNTLKCRTVGTCGTECRRILAMEKFQRKSTKFHLLYYVLGKPWRNKLITSELGHGQTDRQAGRQADRQTDRQTERMTCCACVPRVINITCTCTCMSDLNLSEYSEMGLHCNMVSCDASAVIDDNSVSIFSLWPSTSPFILWRGEKWVKEIVKEVHVGH